MFIIKENLEYTDLQFTQFFRVKNMMKLSLPRNLELDRNEIQSGYRVNQTPYNQPNVTVINVNVINTRDFESEFSPFL